MPPRISAQLHSSHRQWLKRHRLPKPMMHWHPDARVHLYVHICLPYNHFSFPFWQTLDRCMWKIECLLVQSIVLGAQSNVLLNGIVRFWDGISEWRGNFLAFWAGNSTSLPVTPGDFVFTIDLSTLGNAYPVNVMLILQINGFWMTQPNSSILWNELEDTIWKESIEAESER